MSSSRGKQVVTNPLFPNAEAGVPQKIRRRKFYLLVAAPRCRTIALPLLVQRAVSQRYPNMLLNVSPTIIIRKHIC